MSAPSNLSASVAATGRARAVLAVVSAGVVAMTLNWFAIAPALGSVSTAFHASVPRLALLLSVFIAGNGAFHIPAGFLATRLGLRTMLVAGLAVEGVAGALSGLAGGYWQLMLLRILCGIGASIFASVGIAAVSVWFAGRGHALALGILSAAFSLGAALGLYEWGPVVSALGWRAALVVGGAAAVAVAVVIGAVYRVPPASTALGGVRLTRDAIRQTLGNRRLWRYGLAFLGGYGAYFAASQLIQIYAHDGRGFTAGQVGLAALLIGLGGIPGSIAAGWLSDRLRRRRAVLLGMIALEAAGLLSVPVATGPWIWLPALVVGFAFNGSFAVWETVPGEDPTVRPEHIGIAIGLMLTICAAGGFVIPWVFGLLVPAVGYPAAWAMLGAVTLGSGLVAVSRRDAVQQAEPRSAATLPIIEAAES